MKLSTRSRYGLRTLLDIALQNEEGPVSLSSIATRQDISMNYLEQMIAKLKKAGFVESKKGARGGYCLKRLPQEIRLSEVIKCLEGPLHIVDYNQNEETSIQRCLRKEVWERIDLNLLSVLEKLTLQDLIEEHQALQEGNVSMFFEFMI